MKNKSKFKAEDSKVDFIDLEHRILDKWNREDTFNLLRDKNKDSKPWSFIDGPITANNPMGVHHAWGRTLKDIFQRYHAMQGYDLRYQNGFDCQGLWVEIEVEKELGFKSKRDVEEFGLENFVNKCKERVLKYSKIQTEQSKRLGYWMDWDNSYFTMSDENNYTIWAYLKKLYNDGKIYKGKDVVPWSGRSGTSYSQMEIIEGRKLVAHTSVFVRLPLKDRKNEYILIWTTTPWTLTSNVAVAINTNLDYIKIKSSDEDIYYFAKENLEFKRLDKQFKDKKQWIKDVPKLKTISQIFKERGGYKELEVISGKDMIGWEYNGPFDELPAQMEAGGYPYINKNLKNENINAIACHKIIDGGKDSIGNDIVVAGEGTGMVHTAPGCGAIDNKIAQKSGLVSIAPLDEESCYIEGFGDFTGKCATDKSTLKMVLSDLKNKDLLLYQEEYPHVYPHCWRSGDELVFRIVDEWYINMDWRDSIKDNVHGIKWIPEWGHDREIEWLDNMGDWMISKKRFWGLALPIWEFEDDTFYVVGSREELEHLAVEGWEDFKDKSPHRPWIDKVKIRHPESGLIGTRIPDVGNPWLDAGIVPYSTLHYNTNKNYWKKWFPADFVVECFPGQFRNWFYSLLALSTIMEDKAPFKTLLGHALVKDENGRDMHKSWGNAIWFDDAAEKMGVDVMRWMYASQNPEHNLSFGYGIADEVRKQIITLWNTYSFFITYANLDGFDPSKELNKNKLTKSDKWILSKINIFIKKCENFYEKYEVYQLMSHANILLDNLSNWYIRRNRRRFWKSENDSDKFAAYWTLYNVLISFVKVMAPIVPFLTERIYCNLVSPIEDNASIHLCNFPKVSDRDIDKDIINEIDIVIQIVSLSRSARNKANIKIRQPLEELLIYGNDSIKNIAKNNKEEILEELNIKSLSFASNLSQLLSYNLKPNFQLLGQKYGKEIKIIAAEILKVKDQILIDNIRKGNSLEINLDSKIIKILPSELIIEELPTNRYEISTNNDLAVGIYTEISKRLMEEGLVRDLIRQVQNLRKDSDFKIEERINIQINGSEDLYLALNNHKDYFMNEVLGLDLDYVNSINYKFYNSIKIAEEKVEFGISPII